MKNIKLTDEKGQELEAGIRLQGPPLVIVATVNNEDGTLDNAGVVWSLIPRHRSGPYGQLKSGSWNSSSGAKNAMQCRTSATYFSNAVGNQWKSSTKCFEWW